MGGTPCIRGMRVTVGMIVEALSAGRTIEQLLADFPYLEEPDIREALAFAASLAVARSWHSQLMRILVEMNLTPRWASYLDAAGHTAIHWSEVGSIRAKDREICDYARHHNYVLLTNDLDFPRILAHTGTRSPA